MRLSPRRAFALAATLACGVGAFGFLDLTRGSAAFQWSFVAPGLALLGWGAMMFEVARRRGRILVLRHSFRPQHYVQASAQTMFLLYWGWFWRPVYDSALLIVAQLVFAYAFDLLLCWSRRDMYTLGFGPVPVILSINLFLWFGDEYYYLQFVLIALGFTAKELIRWNREGRHVHIFNPSSFPLAVFSLVLILTGASDITWGQDIAISQFYPPHVYVVLFLVALPGQYLFGVASMTLSAVVATYVFGLFYLAATGTYFFYDSYIPIAVFLGMLLLFTDPSTAPRTELGRIVFGVLYGLSTVALYFLLTRAGIPPFYDKLLQVPLLNLSVRALDRLGGSGRLRALDFGTLGRSLSLRQRHLAYMAAWVGTFTCLSALQAVGDRHAGQGVPFWQTACEAGSLRACSYLTAMQQRFCQSGSGWACNEAGILQADLASADLASLETPAVQRDLYPAQDSFANGCDLGFQPSCGNLMRLRSGQGQLRHAEPTLQDLPIVLRGTKGPIRERTPHALYARACAQGWAEMCHGPAQLDPE